MLDGLLVHGSLCRPKMISHLCDQLRLALRGYPKRFQYTARLKGHKAAIHSLSFSSRASLLASGGML